jgi:hypothetical protein
MNKTSIVIWAVTLVAIVATFTAKAVIAKYDYQRGVNDTIREAYEMGLVETVVLPNGAKGFRWIETHKLGYE